MERFGVLTAPVHVPPLAPEFLPLGLWNASFLADAEVPVALALEGLDGRIFRVDGRIHRILRDADRYYLRQLVRTLIWTAGGWRLYCSHPAAAEELRHFLAAGSFDAVFMESVYRNTFTVIYTESVPVSHTVPQPLGGHTDGCRIGFDAGGSDRKAAAVRDGQVIYTEEVVWSPRTQADPAYHYAGITAALRSAAAHLPRVDAVGVSTAGICLNDRILRSSLFAGVPPDLFKTAVPDIFLRAVADLFGPIPCRVVNDGDVSALSGAEHLGRGSVLGIAMGTSEAGGFADESRGLTGWLNELAFVPVDAAAKAPPDPWSGARGCGSQYFSQTAVFRLAERAGITVARDADPALRLQTIQKQMDAGDPRSALVFESIGVFLGHTLALYHGLYRCRCVLLQGRVLSGSGGALICSTARRVLQREYPGVDIDVLLPEEAYRRLGQATAAAGLPAL